MNLYMLVKYQYKIFMVLDCHKHLVLKWKIIKMQLLLRKCKIIMFGSISVIIKDTCIIEDHKVDV